MAENRRLVLGSGSVHRARFLRDAGYDFEVRVSGADESVAMVPPPESAVVNAALLKARSISIETDEVLLTADTIVWFNGQIIGKPKNREDAIHFLKMFRGKNIECYTGIVVKTVDGEQSEAVRGDFLMRKLSDAEIEAYVAAGIACGHAGAFTTQGYGSTFVETVSGSYSTIEGLPMSQVFKMLKRTGVVPDLKKSTYRNVRK